MRIKQIHMLSLEDSYGDAPGFGSWRCEVEYEDGTIKEGYCDGDEHNAVESTLELDEENT